MSRTVEEVEGVIFLTFRRLRPRSIVCSFTIVWSPKSHALYFWGGDTVYFIIVLTTISFSTLP